MNNNKKIQLTQILITIFICCIFSFVTIAVCKTDNNISQTQNVNINTDSIARKVNLNTATKEELKSLNGIGDKLAAEIINHRPYKSIWDICTIDGIGENTVRNIEKEVTVND